MKCQRSGFCCVAMAVIVIVPGSDGAMAAMKPDGVVCPHLSVEHGQVSCAVHHHPDFEGSPCHVYGNSDYDPDFLCKRGQPCSVGKFVKENFIDVFKGARRVELGELEVLGRWPPREDRVSERWLPCACGTPTTMREDIGGHLFPQCPACGSEEARRNE